MMTMRDQLLTLAHRYAEITEITPPRIARRIFNDAGTFNRIKEGGDVVTANFEHALQWFSDNWPKRYGWPRGIRRPQPQRKRAA